MLLNHYYDVLYDWQREIESLREAYLGSGHPPTTSLRVTIVPPMTSRIGRGSPGSLMVTLSTTIHALTVGRIIVPVCAS